ncbi:hypothetical protein [Flagellimonas sp.]
MLLGNVGWVLANDTQGQFGAEKDQKEAENVKEELFGAELRNA